MKKLLFRKIPAVTFIVVTLSSFLLLSRFGSGFPFLNPRPWQLIVSFEPDSTHCFPEMVYTAGGPFYMGDPTGKSASALPVRYITVSDFFISRYEITFSQYDRYCRERRLPLPPDGGYGRKERPVGNVSWFDAVGYCNWLSRTDGFDPCYLVLGTVASGPTDVWCDYSRNGYRLPTEAEWEYAASGGPYSHSFIYAGSNRADEVAWYFNNSGRYPNSVAGKKPNELGLYDLSGNAYEWTNNRLTDDYKDLMDGTIDPVGPLGERETRTLRGGSCFFDSWGSLIWYRKGLHPEYRLPYAGFRIVRRTNQ
ncbi:MAG: SUMF1/EgtB/PvdO family nonheme iron enzyme [Spirochaetales bacterium]|nr:SUMF1/EgtB/PvdO family nonheme iron enzyme [Spirochaetales bacterium]